MRLKNQAFQESQPYPTLQLLPEILWDPSHLTVPRNLFLLANQPVR